MLVQILSNEGIQAALFIFAIFIGFAAIIGGSAFFDYLRARSKDRIAIEKERTEQLRLQLKLKEKNQPQPKEEYQNIYGQYPYPEQMQEQ